MHFLLVAATLLQKTQLNKKVGILRALPFISLDNFEENNCTNG